MSSISQKFALYNSPHEMEPLLPSEHVSGPLLEQAHDLMVEAQRLNGFCHTAARLELRGLLRSMNSYYSNKIEGQHTLPSEIEDALKSDFAQDADKARRQHLAVAHIHTEEWLESAPLMAPAAPWASCFEAKVLCNIHGHLFNQLPENDISSELTIEPGVLRTQGVSVGRHAAPAHEAVVPMLARWAQVYGGARRGEMQVLAAAASHHRLAWIHPFLDGNGRVARLHTHALFRHMGLTTGLWSPLRGFARSQERYYATLAAADEARAGDLDGRGNLTERGLISWISYVLEVSLDQVRFMSEMLQLDGMLDRMAACLAFEENVIKQGVRSEAQRPLHYLFSTQGELERADFKLMTGLAERQASGLVSALLKRGLVKTDTPYGKLRFAVPLHALRFYFPALWPEAQV
jgi:Fic family protein